MAENLCTEKIIETVVIEGVEFSIIEKAYTLPKKEITSNDFLHGSDDYIFLLRVEEIVKYFGDSGDLEKRKGWYGDNNAEGFWVLRMKYTNII